MFRYLMFFFFNDTATTEIYTLSLHDALPISTAVLKGDSGLSALASSLRSAVSFGVGDDGSPNRAGIQLNKEDRKSTRLNSSHANISYAVFCLKKKKYIYSKY